MPRIVLTGGPGGGKTTAADFFRRELGEQVVVVPEAATIVFAGGFPRLAEDEPRRAAQRAIYAVQRNLEDVQRAVHADKVLLCDRGTLDSAVYWPGGPEAFFEALGTSYDDEIARYDAVMFFESAAVGGLAIDSGNPVRNESLEQAADLDRRLREVWSPHPRFAVIPHSASFFRKITLGLATLESLIAQLGHARQA